jgi:hypothetical protein
MRFIQQAMAGFGGGVVTLLYAGAVLATAWAGSYLRDRSSDPVRAARVLLLSVFGIALLVSVFFAGRRVFMFVFLLVLFGVPALVGMAPRGFWRDLLRPDAPTGGERLGDQFGDRLR